MKWKHVIGWVGSIMLFGTLVCDAKADPSVLTGKTLPLWEGETPFRAGTGPGHEPSITVYLPEAGAATGAGLVVCPGGGYGGLALDHEGEQIAQWALGHGMAAFVVQYRHAPLYRHPVPLTDAQRAIRTVRHRAKDYRVDPAKIGIIGFSAGGHLTATAGTKFDAGAAEAADPIDRESSRPGFMILMYPVITFTDPYTHKGSRGNLLDTQMNGETIALMSAEQHVTAETPPSFLVHTGEDTAVPVQNSLMFYTALVEHGVPAEMHLFEKGAHGLGLGKDNKEFSAWPDLCVAWLRLRGFLPAAP
ncbi:MAG: alpha/beta hydrolase [Candidatus Hydrogenedentes bacterium]|nr:alpha/beta hydrolase [Candidatus Hydrogenedentota bacterium]